MQRDPGKCFQRIGESHTASLCGCVLCPELTKPCAHIQTEVSFASY